VENLLIEVSGGVMAKAIPRLKERYINHVIPTMMQEFGYKNVMQVPRLVKVVVNVGVGEAVQNPKAIDAAMQDLATITGQKPIVRKAKKSIAAFKLRAGTPYRGQSNSAWR
jgi:large subunit ribosomal protein L5